ncbi:ribosomal L7Ae/L30e/S12e/Gadd45 family protein [Macrococcoides canis]|uniref:50S ribosomal protein L7ae-like protein n=1 Tax=Macrococcoides canis TaxID=1855823 RepID=A0A4R6C475_9STAP|nr:ribosomal L7Ae/L30e/S12e/Gadd45 family protein [Macrococcus canis]MEE1107034.1 ribosomal L7Ae/L30e/S12e/Gadd45 family protein [Macrococcus canis]TDM16411.1 50S ribosomal protein L7ae-like protein [Macrococcus canis]TDM19888.1 50S ribosomal protein L7ae-like protein [Macrococcus canis]TDM29704.1 50S ribosomal protein L7ae-like protein [Macrococcus canis]TDM32900.1 50S ribosomal protein L7ae-like protein [Macrococcus canis]
MSNEKVMHSSQYVVGLKETLKSLKKGTVSHLVIAQNTEIHLLTNVLLLAYQQEIPIEFSESKETLGIQYGIQVRATVVAHLKPAL